MDYLQELRWRGLLHQTTSEAAVTQHLSAGSRVAYCGFDPTAASLTIGNFIPIKLLMHWQRCGHTPIVLIGGGTGLIGDPSGKDAERQLASREKVQANVEAQKAIFARFIDFSPRLSNRARLVNNADWLEKVGYIEMLRDVGKHFSINAMIARDSVRNRLENREQGISYTEFSYMILQAYDFLHLYRDQACTVQIAGSDQFGNIVSGIDLIRRSCGHDEHGEPLAFGITAPLITRADGKKIGKSEKGAVWLTADHTSPYRFYQFWINAEDADVISYLKWFTLMSEQEVAALAQSHGANPGAREAHRALARHMTELVHGRSELDRAEKASQALFSGEVRDLDAAMLDEIAQDVPSTTHDATGLGGEGLAIVDLLAQTSLASSKRESREFLQNGAVIVNGEKASVDRRLTRADLLHGRWIFLRRGKKNWHSTRWNG